MEKAELQIFGNQGRMEMRKRNFTYFKDQTEKSCAESYIHIFANKGRAEVWKKQNLRYLAIKAECKCGGGTSHLWK